MVDKNTKSCVVCKMPLASSADYPSEDTSKDYCKHCGDSADIYSYEKLMGQMTGFIMDSEKLAEEEAKEKAELILEKSEAMQLGRIKNLLD